MEMPAPAGPQEARHEAVEVAERAGRILVADAHQQRGAPGKRALRIGPGEGATAATASAVRRRSQRKMAEFQNPITPQGAVRANSRTMARSAPSMPPGRSARAIRPMSSSVVAAAAAA